MINPFEKLFRDTRLRLWVAAAYVPTFGKSTRGAQEVFDAETDRLWEEAVREAGSADPRVVHAELIPDATGGHKWHKTAAPAATHR